jgi:hypothetical protein
MVLLLLLTLFARMSTTCFTSCSEMLMRGDLIAAHLVHQDLAAHLSRYWA